MTGFPLPVFHSDSGKALSAKSPASPPKKSRSRHGLRPLTRIARDTNKLVLSWQDGMGASERQERRRAEARKQLLAARMSNATTSDEWEAAARELDHLEGNDEWRAEPASGDYQPDLIRTRLQELEEARASGDIRTMMYLVRTSLSRDLGRMGNVDLYRHSYVGTKQLIERYVASAVQTIGTIVEQSTLALPDGMETRDLLEGMLYARQSFGRSALLLSGGATLGMAHVGVVKAMFEARLLPRILSGASAGSIVCSVLCTLVDDEMPAVLARFPHGDLAVFEKEPGEGVLEHVRRLLTEGSWSDIGHLTRVMRGMLGDMTFQEAYNRTRRICNICVSSASIYDLPRLLNYVTAPNVMIWSAVAASCSVPLVFDAAPLLIKDPATGAHMSWNPTPQRWIDGSVDNDLPMTHLAEMFNVNHFIVSQVNPHVVPFLARDERLYAADEHPHRARHPPWLQTLTTLAKDEAVHRLHFLAELGILPNLFTKLRSILNQKYSGDITILPEIAMQDLPRILKNPDSDFMKRNCGVGERATWPKLSRIRDRCAIELALDAAVHALRARVVFSTDPGPDLVSLPATGLPVPVTVRHDLVRRRRSSASSIQLSSHHKRAHPAHGDRLETDVSRPASCRTSALRPRLRRAAKSQHVLSSHPRPPPVRSGMSATDVEPAFDFARPLTPPARDGGVRPASAKSSPSHVPASSSETPVSPRPDLLSPTDGASELDSHTSDAGMEDSRTEESDEDGEGRSRWEAGGEK